MLKFVVLFPSQSRVCDPDGLLSSAEKDDIDDSLRNIFLGDAGKGEQRPGQLPGSFPVSDCNGQQQGFQVAVAVMRHIAGAGDDLAHRAEEFTKRLHDTWGVGDACGECPRHPLAHSPLPASR